MAWRLMASRYVCVSLISFCLIALASDFNIFLDTHFLPIVKVPISYVLNNGDVVSILTGEGKGRPTTEWMRFAKSRSTRSKLRAYFRTQQQDSVTKLGESLFFNYLSRHSSEIIDSSYLGYEFRIPTNKSELSRYLPGRSHYTDVDELLFAIGKFDTTIFLLSALTNHFDSYTNLLFPSSPIGKSQSNVNFLRTKVSKIFLVPLKVLESSDKILNNTTNGGSQIGLPYNPHLSTNDVPEGEAVEYADSEHACRHCLPIRGDAIVGTRGRKVDSPTIVHRAECPYAQQAIIDAKSAVLGDGVIGDPVKIIWPEDDAWEEWNKESFLVEIVVMANDRKLLLADCSVIASKNSEILKTGSSTTLEHCTLEFLVKLSDLDELQNLMDKLMQVESVMSVERRFGSELLE
jgi:(p)ppGpp synthase/HD superfamily hydrolase